jgi:hypothetical protein
MQVRVPTRIQWPPPGPGYQYNGIGQSEATCECKKILVSVNVSYPGRVGEFKRLWPGTRFWPLSPYCTSLIIFDLAI